MPSSCVQAGLGLLEGHFMTSEVGPQQAAQLPPASLGTLEPSHYAMRKPKQPGEKLRRSESRPPARGPG